MRSILHWDGDAFFASIEQAADKRLRGRPVVIGGDRRGVVLSSSVEARRFGIRPGLTMTRARRLCPTLLVLPGDSYHVAATDPDRCAQAALEFILRNSAR